ncbi:ECF-type sigma factor [Mariniblastus fucicola]|uniref:ECF sigma factor n=1 Tax=Mariniblastus fucicola TaxID=980251 RepID=A0A5B9P4C3_9BACT|nr:ECF-type sigma factor [Mariniblastus fucicola]QEG21084.1 ECF sigma factor [Mariniblastus fucicola]
MAGSITGWLDSVRQGNDEAAKNIWDRWFDRLCARVSPHSGHLRIHDNEDIASDAFADFFRALREGKFSALRNRSEIWKLLATIAVRKSAASYRFEQAQRRGGGQKVYSFEEMKQHSSGMTAPRKPVTSNTIEELIQTIRIKNPILAQVARMKIECLDNQEIANELNCSVRRVQYMVKDLENEILGRNSILEAS